MSRKVKILILASVLLNVLLTGMILGHFSHWIGHTWSRSHAVDLPQEKKDYIQAALRKAFKENRSLHDEMRRRREHTLRILKTEPFDEAAYQREVENIHTLRGQMMQHLADTVKKLAKELSPEERQALAEILRRPPPYKRLPGGYPPPPL